MRAEREAERGCVMPVSRKQYDAAFQRVSKELTFGEGQRLLKTIERGAIEHGRREMRKLPLGELRGKGWKELADYFGKLVPR